MCGRKLLPYRAVAALMKPAEYRFCRGWLVSTVSMASAVISVLATLVGMVSVFTAMMSVRLPACLILRNQRAQQHQTHRHQR